MLFISFTVLNLPLIHSCLPSVTLIDDALPRVLLIQNFHGFRVLLKFQNVLMSLQLLCILFFKTLVEGLHGFA